MADFPTTAADRSERDRPVAPHHASTTASATTSSAADRERSPGATPTSSATSAPEPGAIPATAAVPPAHVAAARRHHAHPAPTAAAGATGAGGVPELTARALIGVKEAGVVIGKMGNNIRAIRDTSHAKVNVSEHFPGAQERILTVTGAVDEIAKAFAQVARMLNHGDLRATYPDAVESTPLTIRFLIPHSRMGSVIGKGGQRIKEIQEESNARLVATATPLPHSQDRLLEMIGVPDAIHIATYHMFVTISEQAHRLCHDRPYRPEYALTMAHAGMHHVAAGAPPGPPYGRNTYHPGAGAGPGGAHGGGAPVPGAPYGAAPGGNGASAGGPVETRTFYCPPNKVGAMIGKGGTKINRVRMQSGCKIQVEDERGARGDVPFTVTGAALDVDRAMRLLETQLRHELQRDEGHALHHAQTPAGLPQQQPATFPVPVPGQPQQQIPAAAAAAPAAAPGAAAPPAGM